jgi:glycosyltransferase involved in cell wall biosynthesis
MAVEPSTTRTMNEHNKLRITYIHQHFATPADSTGTRSYEFAKRFVEMGHEVNVVAADAKSSSNRWRAETVNGINVHWIGIPYSNKMNFRERIFRFFEFAYYAARRSSQIPADVIFATSTPLTIALPAAYAAKKRRVPMVFEVRDLWPELPIALGALRNPIARWAAQKLEAFAYRSAEHVVALSPGMAEGVARIAPSEKPVTVISNSCDLEKFGAAQADRKWLQVKFGVPSESPVVLYGGTLGLANDTRYLVDLAEHLEKKNSNVVILIVGDGAEWSSVRADAESRKLLDRIIFFHPAIEKREMPRLVASADLCCSVFADVPELWNNSANKFFDALAAAKPIFVNHFGWQSELLENSGAGFRLSAKASADDAVILDKKMGDRQWLQEARKAAAFLAKNYFDRDAHARQLIGILKNTADKSI